MVGLQWAAASGMISRETTNADELPLMAVDARSPVVNSIEELLAVSSPSLNTFIMCALARTYRLILVLEVRSLQPTVKKSSGAPYKRKPTREPFRPELWQLFFCGTSNSTIPTQSGQSLSLVWFGSAQSERYIIH